MKFEHCSPCGNEIDCESKGQMTQYRLLDPTEVLQEGDEFYNQVECQWIESHAVFQASGMPYRRAIQPVAQPDHPWIKLSERLPDKYPCQVGDCKRRRVGIARICYDVGDRAKGWPCVAGWTYDEDGEATHWKPLQLSDPPPPEQPAEEVAFEKWLGLQQWSESTKALLHDAWLAAIAYQKQKSVEENIHRFGHNPTIE